MKTLFCIVSLVWLLAGCAGPAVPQWRSDAATALQRAVESQLEGDDRVAAQEAQRARAEIAKSGQVQPLARAELALCAARLASLQYAPCAGFERLRVDAAEAERAYADRLAGTLGADRTAALPAPQQALARPSAGAAADLALLQGIADPLSRLVGAALWLREGRATPGVVAIAAETASAQGWRRPLLAWLRLAQERAEAAGDRAEAARIARRIEIVLQGAPR